MCKRFKRSDETDVMNIFDDSDPKVHYFLPQKSLDKQREIFKAYLSSTWVVEKNDEIIGFICLLDGSSNEGIIGGIYVKDTYRGMGYGKRLINHAKSLKETLSLAVYEKNEIAFSFYKKLHFKEDYRKDDDDGFAYIAMKWNKNG